MTNGRKQRFDKSPFVALGEAVSITGLCPATLRKFADSQMVRSYKTPTGHRMFDRQSLLDMCSSPSGSPQSNDDEGDTRQNFLYARVSSKHQMDDLARQLEFLQRFATSNKLESCRPLQDIGSGLNFKRKGLQTILDACLRGTIGSVVVGHKDRLSRLAFDLIESLVERAGGKVIVCDDSNKDMSDERELAEDLMSIVHVFSCRQMGKRRYSRKQTGHASDSCIDSSHSSTSDDSHALDAHV